MDNVNEYLKQVDRLQRILKVELFFRSLADLAAYPFEAAANRLHLHWVAVYDKQRKGRK